MSRLVYASSVLFSAVPAGAVSPRRSPAPAVRQRSLGAAALARVTLWLQIAAERRALANLGDDLLADIGQSPASAAREASRPFWDAPSRL